MAGLDGNFFHSSVSHVRGATSRTAVFVFAFIFFNSAIRGDLSYIKVGMNKIVENIGTTLVLSYGQHSQRSRVFDDAAFSFPDSKNGLFGTIPWQLGRFVKLAKAVIHWNSFQNINRYYNILK